MDDEVYPGENTHQELAPTSMLSIIANLTSFSDFNKSLRNMYKCRMGKQAMGTPATAIKHRIDNKTYHFQTVRRLPSDAYHAMILDKSSYERGFGYGAIYKSEIVDSGDFTIRGEPALHHFGLGLDAPRSWKEKLNKDGLLCIGVALHEVAEDPHQVPHHALTHKFSSHHGQKGVCSQKWSSVDMTFSESDIQPDVIVNSHTFPSHMTIVIFVESLAGKSRVLHGMAQDATPFIFDETFTTADYFGDQLKAAGYNYHGNEPKYSGITGEEFKIDIYLELSTTIATELVSMDIKVTLKTKLPG
ncbi:hypothetical protein EDD21DRAFT_440448 [Dissophora ornata]|nr:hypothetical protein EDD21DRAFT_440448 [Dissophora ornata]